MNDCIFCKIIKGDIPTQFVYENNQVAAFLDIHPSNPGHLLVVPKKHADDFLTADQDDINACLSVIKIIGKVLSGAFGASAFNIVQNNGKDAGQVISHLHWHLIPRYPNDPLRIYPPEHDFESTVAEYREKLIKALR